MASTETVSALCGKSVEDSLVKMSKNFLADKNISFNEYSKDIEGFSRQLCGIPSPCHDVLAHHCLKAADRLTDDLSSESTELVSRNQFMIQQLVSILTHLKMRKLDFSEWSKPVREVLLNFLWRMTHLEDLLCFSNDESIKLEPRLTESLPFLNNVKTFKSRDCTDETIAALCESCEHLTAVDVSMHPRQFTDNSIDSLILCKKLESVIWSGTGSTQAGLVKLLVKSQSKNLMFVNRFSDFSCDFLALLEAEAAPLDTFQLRRFSVYNIDGRHLGLLCKYLPHLDFLNLTYCLAEWPDFSCLDCLKNIRTLMLRINNPPKSIEQLYSLKSENLTHLYLHNCSQISITGLVKIGVHCPNVYCLNLDCVSLLKDVDDLTASTIEKSFQKLALFAFRSGSTACGVELFLMHAVNIKNIYLTVGGCLTDTFLTKVLEVNELKELESFAIWSENNISAEMLKSIIQRCEKLEYLYNFAPSDDSDAVAKAEFECLQKFITENKYSVRLC